MIDSGGCMGFCTRKYLPAKTVVAPTYSTFKNIAVSIVTHSKSFVVACIYHTPSSCSFAFLDLFLFSLASNISHFFLHHLWRLQFHVDTHCINKRKFLNLLNTFNPAQNVNKFPRLHGHILDLILSPSDSSYLSNVTVSDLVSGHALVKCQLDFTCPTI